MFASVIFALSLLWQQESATQPDQPMPRAANAKAGTIKHTDTWLPIELEGVHYNLQARIWRPSGSGPFPLVIINHGTPGNRQKLAEETPQFSRAARWFMEQGFVVVVALRPGYGASEGTFLEDAGPCARENYVEAGSRIAAVEGGHRPGEPKLPGVDADRAIVVGQSAGGSGAVALADHPPQGVRGIIGFAGGRGSKGQGKICGGEDRLLSSETLFGQRNRLPQLWLYSSNDQFFPPTLSQRMADAYRRGSQPSIAFVNLPPFSDDGHKSFNLAPTHVWTPAVSAFLEHVLPAKSAVPLR